MRQSQEQAPPQSRCRGHTLMPLYKILFETSHNSTTVYTKYPTSHISIGSKIGIYFHNLCCNLQREDRGPRDVEHFLTVKYQREPAHSNIEWYSLNIAPRDGCQYCHVYANLT